MLAGSAQEFHQATALAVENAVKNLIETAATAKSEGGKPYSSEEQSQFSKDLNGFLEIFASFLKQRGQVIDWNLIKPPPKGMIIPYSELAPTPDAEKGSYLDKLVVLKLNGGLGTTMGCVGPKSAIEVRSKFTFLDLTVQQIEVTHKLPSPPLESLGHSRIFRVSAPQQDTQCQCALGTHELVQYPQDDAEDPAQVPQPWPSDRDLQSEPLPEDLQGNSPATARTRQRQPRRVVPSRTRRRLSRARELRPHRQATLRGQGIHLHLQRGQLGGNC